MNLCILGAGGYGRIVDELAQRSRRYENIFFLDDRVENQRVLGTCIDFERYLASNTEFYPAFGNNEVRYTWLNRLEAQNAALLTLIDETAYVSPSATIERGTVILPKAIVNTNAIVHRGVIVNCGAIIDHDCVVEECAHICLNAVIKGQIRIPRLMKIDASVVIENRFYTVETNKNESRLAMK